MKQLTLFSDILNISTDGYSYERSEITRWFDQNRSSPVRSPMTGAVLVNRILIQNTNLRITIKRYQNRRL